MQELKYEDLVKSVKHINDDVDYWLVRTNNGRDYEKFKENGFISFGLNDITPAIITSINDKSSQASTIALSLLQKYYAEKRNIEIKDTALTIDESPEEIETENGITIPSNNAIDKKTLTKAINKLLKITEIRVKDRIIIPGKQSHTYCIGVVTRALYTSEDDLSDDTKRIDVRWEKEIFKYENNSIFNKLKPTQDFIRNVGEISEEIDNSILPFYIKNNSSYFTINIPQESDILAVDLIVLLQEIYHVIQIVNRDFYLDEDIYNCFVKINVQSKGPASFKSIGKSVALAGLLIFSSCNLSEKDELSLKIERYCNKGEIRAHIGNIRDTINRMNDANLSKIEKVQGKLK